MEKPKNELVRVIRTPEGEYCIDTTGRKNGRGAYVCNNPECMKMAIRTRGLDRSFKEKIADEVYKDLEEQVIKLG